MNENLFRTQFDQLETTEKQALMESLAARYNMTFLSLHTFNRWGQSSTTGIFEKDGREYVSFPAILSPWAGNGSPLGSVRTAERNWTICSRNGRWNRTRRR